MKILLVWGRGIRCEDKPTQLLTTLSPLGVIKRRERIKGVPTKSKACFPPRAFPQRDQCGNRHTSAPEGVDSCVPMDISSMWFHPLLQFCSIAPLPLNPVLATASQLSLVGLGVSWMSTRAASCASGKWPVSHRICEYFSWFFWWNTQNY